MKKYVLLFVTIIIASSIYAQSDTSRIKTSPPYYDKVNDATSKTDPDTVYAGTRPGRNPNYQTQRDIGKNMGENTKVLTKPDGVMMKKGKMMITEKGKTRILDRDITLSNGTTVMTNGTVIQKDGSKIILNEGEQIDMSGKILPLKE